MGLNILFLTQCDNDGAGKANVNIANGFRSLGHHVEMLVAKKNTNNEFVKQVNRPKTPVNFNNFFPKLKRRFRVELNNRLGIFNEKTKYVEKYSFYNENEYLSPYSYNLLEQYISTKPDIIIVAWISFFINTDVVGRLSLKYDAPAYLIMNDMANITGGCHYAWDCVGYQSNCNNCPAIINNEDKNRAADNLQNKRKSIEKYGLKIVSATKSTKDQAKLSSLFREQLHIRSINGLVDFNIFNTNERDSAKAKLGYDNDCKIIFAGATHMNDPRKGFNILNDSLLILNEKLVHADLKIKLILLGSDNIICSNFSQIDIIHKTYTNNIDEYSLLHKAANVYVSPSIEDSGPSMVIHALSSGTPVVGFEVGFVKDFVKEGINGSTVANFSSKLLATKLFDFVLQDDTKSRQYNCSESVRYSFSVDHLQDFLKDEGLI